MKRNLLTLSLAILFLIGCGTGSNTRQQQAVADMSAATIGYLVGQSNLEKIPDWNAWLDKLLAFNPGDSVLSYETLLAKAFEFVEEPFIEMQLNKLIRLLEFPELQPPGLPFLKAEYLEMVRIVLSGFRDGLYAAQAEKQ